MSNLYRFCLAQCFILVTLTGCASYEKKAIRCVIGEAEGESYEAKVAVSRAIIDRGCLKGVYGCSSARVRNKLYSRSSLIEATMAYNEAKKRPDIVSGANHWIKWNMKKYPSWTKKCEPTAMIGNHIFYKCP